MMNMRPLTKNVSKEISQLLILSVFTMIKLTEVCLKRLRTYLTKDCNLTKG